MAYAQMVIIENWSLKIGNSDFKPLANPKYRLIRCFGDFQYPVETETPYKI